MDAEAQVETFIDKFEPASAALIRDLREALRRRFPDAVEMVWDNYNFLVFGYGPADRPSDYVVSLAAAANGVSLSFNRGAELQDPDAVLQGSAKVNRFIRLPTANVLARPEVEAMITRACELNGTPRPWSGEGRLVVRGVAAKQRPRRKV